MNDSNGQLRLLVTGPAACALVLAGILIDNRRYHSDADYDAYHRRAKLAVEAIPTTVGPWVGTEKALSAEELALLQPNAYRYVTYHDTRPEAVGDPSRWVTLLVDQCRWANNMLGHYPPKCYPARGEKACCTEDLPAGQTGRERVWKVNGVRIHGMEYFFERTDPLTRRPVRRAVYDFMALPQQGVRADMESVAGSAEDYQQRYYGAAQFQFVFGGDLAEATPQARAERDDAFTELIGKCSDAIKTLCDGKYDHE